MSTDHTDILLVLVTAANQEEAARISEEAVRAHLAACATTIPTVHSLYWWEGKVVSDQEAMILLKTTTDKFPALQEAIQKLHSYKVPEILGIPINTGLPQYLDWIRRETT
jgi:periplasmic divalent cation tolerance protein